MIFNKINLPSNIGGFDFEKVVDYEKSNKGMGYGLEYGIAGCKATIYIYDRNLIVPNDIEDKVVEEEFVNNIGEVFSVYQNNVEVTQKPMTIETEKLKLYGIGFKYKGFNNEESISYLYLTTLFGNFVKMRLTFSAEDRPELGESIHNNFMTELFVLLNSQI